MKTLPRNGVKASCGINSGIIVAHQSTKELVCLIENVTLLDTGCRIFSEARAKELLKYERIVKKGGMHVPLSGQTIEFSPGRNKIKWNLLGQGSVEVETSKGSGKFKKIKLEKTKYETTLTDYDDKTGKVTYCCAKKKGK